MSDNEKIYWIATRGNLNWSGKEFSTLPAKVYDSYMHLSEAINAYRGCCGPDNTFMCKTFGEKQKNKLLEKNKIRL